MSANAERLRRLEAACKTLEAAGSFQEASELREVIHELTPGTEYGRRAASIRERHDEKKERLQTDHARAIQSLMV